MKHTFATMLLTALFCAVAAQGMAEDSRPSVYTYDIHGGTVKFYGADPASNPTTPEISQAAPGTTVYLVPEPDAFHATEGMQLQAVKAAHSDVAESRAGTPGYAEEIVLEQVGQTLVYRFTMPAGGADVMVTATFPKRTQKVKYLDPTKPAGHQECEVEAYILDKPVSELPGSDEGEWFVCTTPAADNAGKGLVIDGTLTIQNNVNLILADGCKMTVSAGIGLHKGNFVYIDGYLSIYAQTTGDAMGQLVATSNSDYGIHLSTLAINGGAITASGPERGILCVRSGNNTVLSINGGRVSAEGTGTGSYGIESHDNMSITGGQVTATGPASGIRVEMGGLDIALSSADDFVVASGYYFRGDTEAHELHLGAVGNDGSGCYLASTPGLSVLTPFAYVAGGITLSADQQAAVAGKRIALTTEVVTYKDASGTLQNIATDTYLDGNGEEKPYTENDITYVLTGTEQEIGTDGKTAWYVSAEDVTCTSQINISGDVRLILADGKTMSVGNSNALYAINGNGGSSLTVYGQSVGSGELIAKANNTGIHIAGNFTLIGGNIFAEGVTGINNGGDVTIHGGTLDLNNTNTAINCMNFSLTDGYVKTICYEGINTGGDVTINGGVLDVTGSNFAVTCYNNFTFNGGKVTAVSGRQAGIFCIYGEIILGFTSPDDYIYASSYQCDTGKCKTAAGKRFVAYGTKKSPGDEGFDPALTTTEATAIIGNAASTEATALSAGKTLRPLVITEPDGQGGTTVSPGYLLGIRPGDITPADKTDSQGQPAPDFTITTGTGDNQVTIPYYIYKAGSEGTTIPLSVPAYGQQGADFTVSIDGAAESALTDPAVTTASGKATAALPWTGANDVELKSARYYCTGVSYMDWDNAQKKLVPKNTDVDVALGTKVYILTGNETTDLPGGWYMVKNWNTLESNNSGIDAFYTGEVRFTGDTHLILGDNARMDVGTEESPSPGNGIEFTGSTLAIYAQSTGDKMGQLNTFLTTYKYGIYASSSSSVTSIIINGGNIYCTGYSGYGITATSNSGDASLTINGGNFSCDVSAGSCMQSLSTAGDASITINAGNISCSISNGQNIYARSSSNNASVFINGGHISVNNTGTGYCIYTYATLNTSIFIYDGHVDLSAISRSIYLETSSSSGISNTLAIYGGKFMDNSRYGINFHFSHLVDNLFLGWKNPDDFIYIKKFDFRGSVSIADGQYMMACEAVDGTGSAFTGTLNGDDINAIKGKYLRPAIYSVDAPDHVILNVTDGANEVKSVPAHNGQNNIPYYIYKDGLTVSASLKYSDMVTDFDLKNSADGALEVTFGDGTTGSSVTGVSSFTYTMLPQDTKILTGDIGVATGGKLYRPFFIDNTNLRNLPADVTVLFYKGLQKNPTTGVIEALFGTAGMVPSSLPIIFANKTDGEPLPATITADADTQPDAISIAKNIREEALRLYMTGAQGDIVGDIVDASLTDFEGKWLTDASGRTLSHDAADYVFFLFTDDRFVPVSANAASQLTGRRYLLAVEKTQLLQLLYGTGTPAPARAADPADAATRAADPSDGVRAFPLIVGNDATAIMGPSLAPELYGAGSSEAAGSTGSAASWYSIDGRRLDSRPRSKGIYIINGKKSVIR